MHILPEPQTVRKNRRMDALFMALLLLLGIAFSLAFNKIGLLAVAGILGVLLAAGIFLQPEWGVLAYVFIVITQLSNILITRYELPSIVQLLAALMTLIILIRYLLFSERPLSGFAMIQIMVIYILTWLIPLIFTDDFDIVSEAAIFNAKRVLGGIIIIYFIRRQEIIRHSIWAIIMAGILMGTITTFQEMTGTYDNEYWGFGNWLRAEDSNLYERHRMTGPYGDPNPYAQVLVVVVMLAFERFVNERKIFLRLFAAWAMIISVLAIFFTYSRGSGFLNLLFTLGVFVLLSRRRMIIPLLALFIFGSFLVQFLPDTYLIRIFTLSELLPSSKGQISDASFLHRLNENTASWNMFLDNPFVGVGIGNFPNTYVKYSITGGFSASAGPVAAPSIYAEILSEQGLLGLGLFIFIIYSMFRNLLLARKIFMQLGRSDLIMLTSAFFAAMAGYMFSGIFKQSAYSNVFWVLFGIAVGIHQVAVELRAARENTHATLVNAVIK